MRNYSAIGLVLVGIGVLGYAAFSSRSEDENRKERSPIKMETNPDIILPGILQKLDDQIRLKNGFIAGLDTFLLPVSSPWLVRCGVGASISLGSVASGSEGSVGSEVDVSLSYDLIDKNACSMVALRIAGRLQDKLAGR
jgi:hypothetical protein